MSRENSEHWQVIISIGNSRVINISILTFAILALIALSNLENGSFKIRRINAYYFAILSNPVCNSISDLRIANVIKFKSAIKRKHFVLPCFCFSSI